MKNFRLQIVIRLLLLALNIFFISYFYSESSAVFVLFFFAAAVTQIFLLIKFADSTNREIVRFLQGINYSDFSQNITIADSGKSFKELSDELEKVLNNFRKARLEKEESLRYLQTVVEHVGIGLVSFNAKGDVELFNKSAKKMLKVSHLKNISDLDKAGNDLGKFLFQLQTGTKSTFKFVDNGEIIQLMIYSTAFRMKEQDFKLISLYNIQPELEEKEIEAWQKLIRVLTHEIMNSITPISSLASTASGMIKENAGSNQFQNENFNDINDALNTIQRRSEGLINFVNKFRDISKIPKPNFQTVKASELFYRIRLLGESLTASNKTEFTFSIKPENLELIADPDLIEHVLINLIKNSLQALSNSSNGRIKLSAEINDRGRAMLKVADNGPGISEEILDRIFVPFFSTKKDGSGIGLSISQSIIRAHGGSIWAQSKPNEETVFTIVL
ncbi:MAG: ATP-binding protein [Ignavibacteriales bacterium]|nr:ATP-binding protein [Ignavibacteriales bacterium]